MSRQNVNTVLGYIAVNFKVGILSNLGEKITLLRRRRQRETRTTITLYETPTSYVRRFAQEASAELWRSPEGDLLLRFDRAL